MFEASERRQRRGVSVTAMSWSQFEPALVTVVIGIDWCVL